MNEDRNWWNNLDRIWKEELISNLLNSPGFEGKGMQPADIMKVIDGNGEKSEEILAEIVNLKKQHLSRKMYVDLTPVFYLKKIDDFLIERPDYGEADASFLYLYPKHLRSKVRRLDIDVLFFDGDLTSLSDFVNLEYLQCQSCHITSLNGIEKLTRLKEFHADQSNFYKSLEPLRGLPLTYLNIEFSKVTDLSPLRDVPTLETLQCSYTGITDFSVLSELPNLTEFCEGPRNDEFSIRDL